MQCYGPPPDGLDEKRAVTELLASRSLYGQEPCNLATFDFEKLKIARGNVRPRHPGALLPADAARFLAHFDTCIEKTTEEITDNLRDQPLPTPYWDPTLRRDRGTRRHLIEHLVGVGLVSFRRRVKAKCAMFFVKKKAGP